MNETADELKQLETRRARMRAINAAIRQGDGWESRLDLTDEEHQELFQNRAANHADGYPQGMLDALSRKACQLRRQLAEWEEEQAWRESNT